MDTLTRFLEIIGSHPWETTWTVIAILFALAIVSRMRANGTTLAVLALVIVVLAGLLWVHQRQPVQAPASPVQASTVEQAPRHRPQVEQASESRPDPYGERQVPEPTGGVQ